MVRLSARITKPFAEQSVLYTPGTMNIVISVISDGGGGAVLLLLLLLLLAFRA